MMSEQMKLCADMILMNAIEDMAQEEHITQHEARRRLIESDAYSALYNPDTALWQEGPDYFRSFYKLLNEHEKNRIRN